ncbi:MAG TPA: LpqB family beta-propeller domain-containing protein [Nocardioidaceae bacterium]|nr:LpqB family beta-propeller domain-containing protein [Nocardioidaceae bacterium]
MTGRLLGLLLAVLSLLGGCVTLPDGGGVTTEQGNGPVDDGAGSYDYTPLGPRPGQTPPEIVEGFLLAMQASPQSTAVARKYLTDEGRAGWFPDKATLVHGAKAVTGTDGGVRVSLDQTVQLDERGSWLGRVGGERGVDYDLEVVRERGEWRIANPPDALIIPRDHFESRYQQFFVYYFDPSGQVLIPQPTYLPHGEQAATLLVRRLLDGPDPRLEGVLRSYVPGDTENVLWSVPVSLEGVAEVTLGEQLLDLAEEDREHALAQLAWTLRQVTGVDSMQVTVDGVPLDVPGAASPQNVSSWTEYDPAVQWASREIFGLLDGAPVALSETGEDVAGVFGAQEYALRDVAADLTGSRIAGVSEDGTTVVLAPRGQTTEEPPTAEQTEVLYTGTDVLGASWDVFENLWLVDRTRRGAQVSVVVDGEVTPVEAPGLAGEDVTDFVVSRDGSRLVAVVPRRTGHQLMLSRVVRTPNGRVRGLTRAVELPLAQGGVDEIRDIEWRTPGSVAVLTGPSPETSQVLLALVDGSTALADVDSTAEIFRRRAVRLVASPSTDSPIYLGTPDGALFELGGDGSWTEAEARQPLFAPTFAG